MEKNIKIIIIIKIIKIMDNPQSPIPIWIKIINNNKNINEIEIDVSNLKYSLNIKYKYSFGEIKNFYEKYTKNENIERPKFINETLTDIISDKKKI